MDVFVTNNTRIECKETDKLAAIQYIWDMFIAAPQVLHASCVSVSVTVNEQLVAFRGSVLFSI